MGSMPSAGSDRSAPVAASVPLGTALPVALGVAVLMSTQLLFQPFVWRNWPLDEILLGWLDALRDCVVIACVIALAVWRVAALPVRHAAGRAVLLGVAIVGGAVLAQFVLALLARDARLDPLALAPAALRWSLLAASVACIHYLWRHAAEARAAIAAAELHRIEIEHQAAQADLQVLRSQIEPHFLFNTLATVRRLHHTEPAEGAQLLAHFLDYLRLTLPARPRDGGRLGAEMDLVRAYLGVVAVRMSGRLHVEWDVAAELREADFPPLVAATLVENAIKHGLAPAPGVGTLRIAARRIGTQLEVEIADTGVGFCGNGGSGIGLANIRARLQTAYGAAASLRLTALTPSGVRATVRLPWSRPGAPA
jgi:hypothetical protein